MIGLSHIKYMHVKFKEVLSMMNNGKCLEFGCYDYNSKILLIEMKIDVSWKWIRWSKFAVPVDGLAEDCWQAAYLEQYLNEDGTEKICDTYDTPAENTAPCRFVFFLYKSEGTKLLSQFGEFDLTNPGAVPERLAQIVEFEFEEDDDEEMYIP